MAAISLEEDMCCSLTPLRGFGGLIDGKIEKKTTWNDSKPHRTSSKSSNHTDPPCSGPQLPLRLHRRVRCQRPLHAWLCTGVMVKGGQRKAFQVITTTSKEKLLHLMISRKSTNAVAFRRYVEEPLAKATDSSSMQPKSSTSSTSSWSTQRSPFRTKYPWSNLTSVLSAQIVRETAGAVNNKGIADDAGYVWVKAASVQESKAKSL